MSIFNKFNFFDYEKMSFTLFIKWHLHLFRTVNRGVNKTDMCQIL